MQAFEDALVAEILRVLPDVKVYINPVRQSFPKDDCVIVSYSVTNTQRASKEVSRRTIITDIALLTSKGNTWAEDKLTQLSSLKIGNVEKLITSGRLNTVDSVSHFNFTLYIAESIYLI